MIPPVSYWRGFTLHDFIGPDPALRGDVRVAPDHRAHHDVAEGADLAVMVDQGTEIHDDAFPQLHIPADDRFRPDDAAGRQDRVRADIRSRMDERRNMISVFPEQLMASLPVPVIAHGDDRRAEPGTEGRQVSDPANHGRRPTGRPVIQESNVIIPIEPGKLLNLRGKLPRADDKQAIFPCCHSNDRPLPDAS